MSSENTLWMGDIEPWMNEDTIMKLFNYYSIAPINIKIIKTKKPNMGNKSYCFITFKNIQEARIVLSSLNGIKMPFNPQKKFRLNWAEYQVNKAKTLYVGKLNEKVNDQDLYQLFSQKYKSVFHANVIKENGTSRGFGFVVLRSEEEYQRCLKEMNGYHFYGNNIRVKEHKKKDDENLNTSHNGINNGVINNNINNSKSNNEELAKNFVFQQTNNNEIVTNNKYINSNNNNNINSLQLEFIANRKNNQSNFVLNQNNNKIKGLILENNINDNNIMIKNSNFISANNTVFNNDSIQNLTENSKMNNTNTKDKNNKNETINNLTKQTTSTNHMKNKNIETKNNMSNENLSQKKYKLEILDNIDEMTLIKKIRQSILRTFEYHKKSLINNGNNFKSKYI